MKKFISNDDLVQQFFADALQEKHVLRDLLVVLSLVKMYGHKLYIAEWYLQIIAKKHPDIAQLYKVLHTLGKANVRDLNAIVKLCKKIYVKYKKEFTISSDLPRQEALDTFIHKKFSDADLSFSETSMLGIDLKGEGYRYHRSLDRDLETLLRP